MTQATTPQASQNLGQYYSFLCPVCQGSFLAPVAALDTRIQCPCSFAAAVGEFTLIDSGPTAGQTGQAAILPLRRASWWAPRRESAPPPVAPDSGQGAEDPASEGPAFDLPIAAQFDVADAAVSDPGVKTYTPSAEMQVKSEMSIEPRASVQLNLEHFDQAIKPPTSIESHLSHRMVRYSLLAVAVLAFIGLIYFVFLSFLNENVRGEKSIAKLSSLAFERETIKSRNAEVYQAAQKAMASASWEDLLSQVRYPEIMRGAMEYLYETKGVPYRPVNLVALDKIERSQVEGGELFRLFATSADGRKLKLMMEYVGGAKGWILDWEYYVNFGDFQWQRFLDAAPGEKVELRASLSEAYVWPAFCQSEGINPDFATAFTIDHAGPKSETFIAVMERYNPVARELKNVLESSSLSTKFDPRNRKQPIAGLELRLIPRVIAVVSKSNHKGPGMRLVRIHQVIQRGWTRLSDERASPTGVHIEARLETGVDVEPVIADREPSLGKRREEGARHFLNTNRPDETQIFRSESANGNIDDNAARIRDAADLKKVPPSTEGGRDDLRQD